MVVGGYRIHAADSDASHAPRPPGPQAPKPPGPKPPDGRRRLDGLATLLMIMGTEVTLDRWLLDGAPVPAHPATWPAEC